jgi:hypothetical protein
MSNSLQDQLKQAGLADEKQARKARQDKKKSKKGNKPSRRQPPAPDPHAEAARRERAEKAERDREANTKRESERRAKETAARIRQIVETHRIERGKGEQAYRFTRGTTIKEAWLSPENHRRLADGEIALVTLGESYELVPKATGERIGEIDEEALLVLNTRNTDSDDDAYADFPIPDDLMW